jgi:hypothetical protein
MIYTNYGLLRSLTEDETRSCDGSIIKAVSDILNTEKPFAEIHKQIYYKLREGKSDQKAFFALDLLFAIDPGKLIVPDYIAEGLEWLQTYLRRKDVEKWKQAIHSRFLIIMLMIM